MGRMTGSKVVARRDLGRATPLPEGWQCHSLADMGTEAFSALMLRASQGDPYDTSTVETAADDFAELVEAAGELFDPSGWLAVSDVRGEIGVVLPQLFPDDPSTGTLFYLGVVPQRRGEGLGRALHAFGLAELSRRGARHYVGSTDRTNTPIIAIFTANGCDVD